MPRHLDNVVGSSNHPVVAVLIPSGRVPGCVFPGVDAPVCVNIALVIPVEGAHHGWPRVEQSEETLDPIFDGISDLVHNLRLLTEDGAPR